MRKFFAGTAAVLAAVLFLSCPAGCISAQSAILIDGDTGRVLYEKQADRKSLIASTTKIMTALLVCENCNVLDIVEIPKEAVGIEGSSLYLQAGEKLTVQELLYGMMLHSGNDGATALAIFCGGDVDGFVEMMNEKANQIGLTHTHFSNPHGLDHSQNYSTARDLATLTRYAMKNPLFAQTVATKTIRMGNRQLTNHNKLLWRVEGANGVKTGYTRAAGRLLVSGAKRQGKQLIAVTVNDGDDWNDHGSLYEQGFAQYRMTKLLSQGQIVGKAWVFGGEKQWVQLEATEDFSFPIASAQQVEIRLSVKSMVYAPVVENALGGYAYLCVDGPVGKVPLRFTETIEQQQEEKKSLRKRWFGE